MAPGYGTASVAFATTPAIVSTFFSHIATWPQRHIRSKQQRNGDGLAPFTPATSIDTLPGQQLRYEEGLYVVKSFLNYASTHGVEEVQDFTAQPVPIPHWVRREVVTIPEDVIDRAAEILTKHLMTYGDGKGIELVGGTKWWQIRGRELEAEWIEMSKNYTRRTTTTSSTKSDKRRSFAHFMTKRPRSVRDDAGGDVVGDRVILYIHGGAFFFSSLDLHRYQIQRHARKAGARAFVPNYRLSPQYPFPCGLLDSLAAYLYLIDPPGGIAPIAPSNIILMGDSAGGGMCISLLILIREMGLPMPAAASLMSPWVDLTHSMPSIMEWDGGDYIPNVGFHYKPSAAWPPIPGDGITVTMPDGEDKLLDEQIQLYCPNKLLTHPLVSPINIGSLGGLCPLYISAGSAELLRDEIIYVAHKAADPTRYAPAPATLKEYPEQAAQVNKYPPTKVHLQVFEGACHVATTLAWTRSAKHIFRGTANFNIWAFKLARKANERREAEGRLPINAEVLASLDRTSLTPPSTNPSTAAGTPTSSSTPIGSEQDSSSESSTEEEGPGSRAINRIKVRGVEPSFGKRTIMAERVTTHGRVLPMESDEHISALNPALRPQVGRIRGDGPVQTWLVKRADWDKRFGVQLKHWRGIRAAEYTAAEQRGFLTGTLRGENPPRCSLVALDNRNLARLVGKSVDEPTTAMNTGVALWMKIGEHADEEAIEGKSKRGSFMKDLGRRASAVFRDKDEKRNSGEKQSVSRTVSRSGSRNGRRSNDSSRRGSLHLSSPLASPRLSPRIASPAPPSPLVPEMGKTPSDPVSDTLAKLTIASPASPTTPGALPTPMSSTSTDSTTSYMTAEEDVGTPISELSPVMEKTEKEAIALGH